MSPPAEINMKLSIFWKHRFETISALGVMFWGAFLLNPFVSSFQIQPSYTKMADIANENVWGVCAALVGVIGLAGMYFNKSRARKFSMWGVVFYRTFTLLLIGTQNHFTNPGTGDFFLWVLIAIFAFMNIENV